MTNTIHLEGTWTLEEPRSGLKTLELPGTADGAGLGQPSMPDTHRWVRDRDFVGILRVSKAVTIPEDWQEGAVILVLERCHWVTRVLVDGLLATTQNSLTSQHRHDLTGRLKPGLRHLTLEIDNRPWIPLDGSTHHLSRDTQGNWNGIIGTMVLEHHDPVSLVSVKTFPRVIDRSVEVVVRIRNLENFTAATLDLEASAPGLLKAQTQVLEVPAGESEHRCRVVLGDQAPLWDEFHPVVHHLSCRLTTGAHESVLTTTFGIREFLTDGKRLTNNGKTVFLRGSHDACVFPLTGHPPMDVASWEALFETYRRYGLNHFRAHSWCPPEACFVAADRLGIYLQVEGPAGGPLGLGQTSEGNWDPLMVSGLTQEFLRAELQRIQDEYGNHPSLVMISIGNELSVDQAFLNETVQLCRQRDNRHLWASGSNNCWPRPRLGGHDQFFVAFMIDSWEGLLRGSYHLSHVGHINNKTPSTQVDYVRASAEVPVPVVTHELGQYLSYPDFHEIAKYTGTMKARHLEAFRDDLAAHGMEGEDSRFAQASGALQVRLYKAEIEAALATSNLAGFQLLDLKDYPGQSVALCGILDAFGDSKGAASPERWRQFCSPVVPLARFSRFTWTEGEVFEADLLVANYGATDLKEASAHWTLTARDQVLAEGSLSMQTAQGTVGSVGPISVPLGSNLASTKAVLSVRIDGTSWANSWDLWIYPRPRPLVMPQGIRITTTWNRESEEFVRSGGRLLFLGDGTNLLHTIPGMFQTNFWTYRMFQCFDPPGTLGTVSDPDHPIFRHFPSDGHTDWQWFDIVKNSPAVEISWCDRRIRPLVQVIDTYERNLKLGILWEVGVGQGGILVSTLNRSMVDRPSPVVAQWISALTTYLGSDDFHPEVHLGDSGRALDQVLKVVPQGTSVPVDRWD